MREYRFRAACLAAARLMQKGYVVFCPIAHSHPVAEAMGSRATDHVFWMAQDLPFLAKAAKLVILKLDGWEHSKGIAEESDFARAHGILIEYMNPISGELIEDRAVPRMGTQIPRLGMEPGSIDEETFGPLKEPETVLQEAHRLVHGDRNKDYQHPSVDYDCTAAFWRAAIKRRYGVDVPLTPDFACLLMALMKISREAGKHKRDSLVDAAGYIECAAWCLDVDR